MPRTALLAAVLLATSSLAAQMQWTTQPTMFARGNPGFAYDPVSQRMLSFGGSMTWGSWQYCIETWRLEPSGWTLAANSGPVGQRIPTMVADRVAGQVLLFGGDALSGAVAGTWAWDGAAWTQVTTTGPLGGYTTATAAAFDPQRARVVRATWTETWEWTGTQWVLVGPTPWAALPHDGLRMSYDDGLGVCVAVTPVPARTYTWDGATWTDVTPPSQPAWVGHVAQFFDPVTGRTMLYMGDQTMWAFDGSNWTQLVLGPGEKPMVGGNVGTDVDWSVGRAVMLADGVTWEWTGSEWQRRDDGAPPDLNNGVSCFDSARGRVVYYDPYLHNPLICSPVWEWDGSRWHRMEPTPCPPSRHGYEASFVYDAARGVAILMGGGQDMWEWDGADWTQRTPGTMPLIGADAALGYDADRGVVVAADAGLFGGQTWEWDGVAWQQIVTAQPAPPSPGTFRGGAWFDEVRRAVLFHCPTYGTAATWEWDGAAWTMLASNAPNGPIAYDSNRRRAVLVEYGVSVYEWDGSSWNAGSTVGLPVPTVHQAEFVVFDGEQVVIRPTSPGNVAAGYDQHYLYAPVDPATIEPLGAGCAGGLGAPVLTASWLPWTGTSLDFELTNVAPSAPVGLVFGFCTGTCTTGSYPASLASVGMPGCLLHVEPQHLFAGLSDASGTATWTLPLCACPSLVGVEFFDQGVAYDPGANSLGFVLSNALAGRVGTF